MTNADLIAIGFEPIPHFTVMNSVLYDLGRDRHLSAGAVGTPNETLYICETAGSEGKHITDLICIHNFDYDGELKLEKVQKLITLLT